VIGAAVVAVVVFVVTGGVVVIGSLSRVRVSRVVVSGDEVVVGVLVSRCRRTVVVTSTVGSSRSVLDSRYEGAAGMSLTGEEGSTVGVTDTASDEGAAGGSAGDVSTSETVITGVNSTTGDASGPFDVVPAAPATPPAAIAMTAPPR